MKNTDTREVIMISIRLSDKNLQADYYPFILEPEARHLFLKELASSYPGHTVMIASTSEVSCPLWLCAGDHEEYVFCVLPINSSK